MIDSTLPSFPHLAIPQDPTMTATTLHPRSTVRSVPFSVDAATRASVVEQLNDWLVDLVALSLRLKQAHWNLRGARFKSIHEQLDEILVDVRAAVDDVAERVVTIGGVADGRPSKVAEAATFDAFPAGELDVQQAVELCSDDLATVVQRGRALQPQLATGDPVSEDLVLGVLGALEKHHWMLRSQGESA